MSNNYSDPVPLANGLNAVEWAGDGYNRSPDRTAEKFWILSVRTRESNPPCTEQFRALSDARRGASVGPLPMQAGQDLSEVSNSYLLQGDFDNSTPTSSAPSSSSSAPTDT
jgi:hypothetical protein